MDQSIIILNIGYPHNLDKYHEINVYIIQLRSHRIFIIELMDNQYVVQLSDNGMNNTEIMEGNRCSIWWWYRYK